MDKDKQNDPMVVPDDALRITEVENIEIEESYKKLIGTASVKFPRGTVVRRTETPYTVRDVAYDKSVQANISSSGVVEEVREMSTRVATVGNFNIGDRIRIYLGYTTDPYLAKSAKLSTQGRTIFNDSWTYGKYVKSMKNMFDGYITKVSLDTPIELRCENLASKLKEVTCKKFDLNGKNTVRDFLDEDGPHQLLKGTGLKLYSKSKEHRYDLGKVHIPSSLTVADVLTTWAKYGLHCFVKTDTDGNPAIAIGRSYFDNATGNSDSIVGIQNQQSQPVKILFDYHVAQNNLSLSSTDKKYLAIEAEGLSSDDKFIHLTLLQNPKYGMSGEDKSKWRVVNESKLSPKAMKLGARPLSDSYGNSVNMDLYSTRPYHSRKIPIDKDELLEEAIKYFEAFNMNGIEGTLVLFGDLALRTGTKVELVDERHPGKNGQYLVEEVNTTFGVGGYRQTIKLPYCIKRTKEKKNVEGEDK